MLAHLDAVERFGGRVVPLGGFSLLFCCAGVTLIGELLPALGEGTVMGRYSRAEWMAI